MIRALPAPLSLPNVQTLWSALPLTAVALFGVGLWLTTASGDAQVYYEARLAPGMYDDSRIGVHSLMYSPAFVFWTEPLRWLTFDAFRGLILALELAALVYMLGPWWAVLALLAMPGVLWLELASANLNLVAGALVVLALSRPGWWAPLALSKVTPAVGGLWHAFRGEWRAVAVAAVVTAVLILPSLILFPGLWGDWLALLAGSGEAARDRTGMPLWIRAPVAVGLMWWAARTDRAWVVPLAVVMALPVTWEGALIGLGAIRLWTVGRRLDNPEPPDTHAMVGS